MTVENNSVRTNQVQDRTWKNCTFGEKEREKEREIVNYKKCCPNVGGI